MKSVIRTLALSLTTLAVSVACVEENKKSVAERQQEPKTGAPAETSQPSNQQEIDAAVKKAREAKATPEELENITGTWIVTKIDGASEQTNPLTAGRSLGLSDHAPKIQFTISRDKLHVVHVDGEATFVDLEASLKIEGKLLETTDTDSAKIPDFAFEMPEKNKLVLRAHGKITKMKAPRRGESLIPSSKIGEGAQESFATYELKRAAEGESVTAKDSKVKISVNVKSEAVQLDSSVEASPAVTAINTKGSNTLICTIGGNTKEQEFALHHFNEGSESSEALVPMHYLHISTKTKFDFSKPSEEITAYQKASSIGFTRIGGIAKSDKNIALLLQGSEQYCSIQIKRERLKATFQVICSNISLAEIAKIADAKTKEEEHPPLSTSPEKTSPVESIKVNGNCYLSPGNI